MPNEIEVTQSKWNNELDDANVLYVGQEIKLP